MLDTWPMFRRHDAGSPLFEDGLPATSWSLTDLATADTGAMCLYYDRLRAGDG